MRLLRSKVSFGQPVLAKLKKGTEQIENSKGKMIFGKDLEDRFRLHGGQEKLRKAFHALFEDEIVNNIEFMLNDEIDNVWSTGYELFDSYKNMRQLHDGQTVYFWANANGQKFALDIPGNPYAEFDTVIKVPVKDMPEPDPAARQTGRLKMRMPQLVDYGVIEFETHSANDIYWIDNYLNELEKEFGTVSGIPLILSRGMRKIKAPDTDNRGNLKSDKKIIREKSLVEIHCNSKWYLNRQVKMLALLGGTQMPRLITGPSGEQIDTTTGEIMNASDELDMDAVFMDEGDDVEEGIFVDAPVESTEDIDINKVGTTFLGPNWEKNSGEILAQWTDIAALSASLKAQSRAWQDFGRGVGLMPMPESAADAADAQKVAV